MSYRILNTTAAAIYNGLTKPISSAVILLGASSVFADESGLELNVQRSDAATLIGLVEDEILALKFNTIPHRFVTPIIEAVHTRLVQIVGRAESEDAWEDEAIKSDLRAYLLKEVTGLAELVYADSEQAAVERELQAPEPVPPLIADAPEDKIPF